MPLYDLRCASGHKFERFIPLAMFGVPVVCACGTLAARLPCAPFVRADLPGYSSPITGEWIEGRAARREDLRKHGFVEWDRGMKEDIQRRTAEEERKEESMLDLTIDKAIAELPVEKRDALAGEMEGGLTAQVVRRTYG